MTERPQRPRHEPHSPTPRRAPTGPPPPRLIDLHVDWPLQYAGETTLFDPALYSGVESRLGQAEGYLGATWAAVIACYRRAHDWARQADPWHALGELLTRVEAEFAGRILMGREDLGRWQGEPDAMTWAVLGIEGFDFLVRSAADVDRLPGLFERGVRLFQPAYGTSGVLAGSAAEGDDRGLTDLGLAFLGCLATLSDPGGPRPLLDLAHLNPRSAGEVLDWYEADQARADRLIPLYSHGAVRHASCPGPRALAPDALRRLRALGGVVGLTVGASFHRTPEALRAAVESIAAVPFRGDAGYAGIAIGTDFLGIDQPTPGLGDAPALVGWIAQAFDAATAASLIQGNARSLFERIAGGGG